MSSYENNEGCAGLVICLLFLVVALLTWPVGSYFEARAYRNATGSYVSTWDAMWLDLRVQAEPQYQK